MLSEEARQRLAARLSGGEGTDQETNPEDTTPVDPEKIEGEQPEDRDGATDKPETPVAEGHHQEEEPRPKMVPLEEVVKLRGERRKLREEMETIRRENAELKGFVKGSRQATTAEDDDPPWLKELLGTAKTPVADAPPKHEDDLSEVQEFMAEYKRSQGQALLDQVVKDCQTQDSTVPVDFLIDNFTAGRSPEAAMQRWAQYKSKFAPPVATTPPVVTRPKAPPFVPAAPSTGGKQGKSNDWKDVTTAVRNAIAKSR